MTATRDNGFGIAANIIYDFKESLVPLDHRQSA
jgi:hypothetical protein